MASDIAVTRREYADKILQRWQDSVAGILEVGQLLSEAKEKLAHGEFEAMVREDLPFGERTARRLKAISLDPRISNRTHVSALPPSWGTLYELTKLDDGTWADAYEAGKIRPDMERKEVLALRKSARVESRRETESQTETATTDDLHSLVGSTKFGVIYADPPWVYSNQATRASTSNHYDGMTVDELCELPVKDLAADDAFLHLWTTNAFLFDCKRIMEAWGFEYRSVFVWVKPQMGIGNYWRVSHEFLLLGRRGSPKWAARDIKSWGQFERRKHSQKPEQIRQYIEKACQGPYLELFGRRPVNDWVVWGNEIEKGIFDQSVQRVA